MNDLKPHIASALDAAGSHMRTGRDWLDLAFAAFDQAGMPANTQERMRKAFDKLAWWPAEEGGR